MQSPIARAAWLEHLARRKNGLNLQIFMAGTLVCLSSIPLVCAFAFPVLSKGALGLFLVGLVMYGARPVFEAGVEARRRLLEEAAARGIRYGELDAASRRLVPRLARRMIPRLA